MEQKVNAFAKCRQWWRCLWLVWVGHPLPGTPTCLPRPPPPACSAMRVSATAASCQKCWSESSLSHRQLPVRSSSRYSAQAASTLHTDIPYHLPPIPPTPALPFFGAVAQSMPHHCHSVTPRETKLLRELLLSHFLTLSSAPAPFLSLSRSLSVSLCPCCLYFLEIVCKIY